MFVVATIGFEVSSPRLADRRIMSDPLPCDKVRCQSRSVPQLRYWVLQGGNREYEACLPRSKEKRMPLL